MDTKLGIAAMPAHEDADETWRRWANAYPTVKAINMLCADLSRGAATFVLDDVPFPPNPNGALNGGIVALATDQVMGVLAARVAPTGSVPVTAVLNVQFHAPAHTPVTLLAQAIPGGRFVQTIEVVARGADGRRCATATGTMAMGSPDRRTAMGETGQ
jgi:acyl-coenzyme A thioesterase PaaI-like protein